MNSVLILGNGSTRLNHRKYISEWEDEIWVCNSAYKEYHKLPRIDRVASVHGEMILDAYNYKLKNNLNYQLITTRKVQKKIPDKVDLIFHEKRGWSTGNLLIVQALKEKYDFIAIVGFDFGGSDIYQPQKLPGDNFRKQFSQIQKEWNTSNVHFHGTPNEIIKQFDTPIIKNTNSDLILNSIKSVPFKDDILIVGNAPSILKEKNGELIDSYNTVVRINDFILEGYEEYTGTKTTHWLTGAGKNSIIKSREGDFYKILFFPRGIINNSYHTLANKVRENLKMDFKDFFIVRPKELETIIRKTEVPFPSTGFMAIAYLLEILNKTVTITGFDFMQSKKHYYDNGGFSVSPQHKWQKEKNYVREQVQLGNIQILGKNPLEGIQVKDQLKTSIKNIFVFGNSSDLKKIDIKKFKEILSKKNIITAGVNRIYKLFQPDYFFFMDGIVLKELKDNQIQREENSKWMIPSFLYTNPDMLTDREEFKDYVEEQEIEEIKIDFVSELKRKSSIYWLVYYLQEYLFPNDKCKFHFFGVTLHTKGPNHYFYNELPRVKKLDELNRQYDSQYMALKGLHENGYSLISLTPNSRLNDFLPYIDKPIEKFIEEDFSNK